MYAAADRHAVGDRDSLSLEVPHPLMSDLSILYDYCGCTSHCSKPQ